ncbi:MAG: hypothetical protein ACI39F_01760, partial [Acutalibacteraceae bacterium]
CGVLDKSAFVNYYHNKTVETVEQIGRIACFAFMIINIPYTYFGFWFSFSKSLYLAVNGVLLLLYCLGWIIFLKNDSLFKVLWLSVVPTVIFFFSGIMIISVPLIFFSVLFGIGHITLSVMNFKLRKNEG